MPTTRSIVGPIVTTPGISIVAGVGNDSGVRFPSFLLVSFPAKDHWSFASILTPDGDTLTLAPFGQPSLVEMISSILKWPLVPQVTQVRDVL